MTYRPDTDFGDDGFEPAEPGSLRFIIDTIENPEGGYPYWLRAVDDQGRVVESFGTDDPYGNVEAYREVEDPHFDHHAAWAEREVGA